jgi:hypothetical protein
VSDSFQTDNVNVAIIAAAMRIVELSGISQVQGVNTEQRLSYGTHAFLKTYKSIRIAVSTGDPGDIDVTAIMDSLK